MACPLCESTKTVLVFEKEDPTFGRREYFQCLTCKLIGLSSQYFLPFDEEKKRYDLHRNNPNDQGYVSFLNQLIDPLCGFLKPHSAGLDFGCGPGPTISVLMKRRGFSIEDYDPIYFPDEKILNKKYDFITATEVVEHFHQPRQEFIQLNKMLKPSGKIGLMTYLYDDINQFQKGWYHQDPTHVSFYHRETMEWIAKWLNWKAEHITKRVVIYSKAE
ncbi:MAG: class I SAM-dependent methyltransferase [Candidatus Omnitrophica bacterium]|nr:class I SAM-dependent methyltransferase [Candidatus Omnitrophota bacterium]